MIAPGVTILFTRRHHIGSLALRTFLWSAWSHCAIMDGDNVIEAAAGHGVRLRAAYDFMADASEYKAVRIPARNPEAVIRAAYLEVGKPYDWLGALGIGVRRKWDDPDKWFCSELIAHAFEAAGEPLFAVKPWRITPRDLYIPRWSRP